MFPQAIGRPEQSRRPLSPTPHAGRARESPQDLVVAGESGLQGFRVPLPQTDRALFVRNQESYCAGRRDGHLLRILLLLEGTIAPTPEMIEDANASTRAVYGLVLVRKLV